MDIILEAKDLKVGDEVAVFGHVYGYSGLWFKGFATCEKVLKTKVKTTNGDFLMSCVERFVKKENMGDSYKRHIKTQKIVNNLAIIMKGMNLALLNSAIQNEEEGIKLLEALQEAERAFKALVGD